MATRAHHNRHIFILADPVDTLDPEFDTTLVLSAGYERAGQSVSWHTAQDILVKSRRLYLSGRLVEPGDIVWQRCDPVNTVGYYEMLRHLCHVEATVLNAPEAVLQFHEKLTVMHFIDHPFYTAGSLENVRRAWDGLQDEGHKKVVIKVPSRFGGAGIQVADSCDGLLEHAKEMLPDSGYVIVQGFIKTGDEQVDTRVLMTPDTVIGALDRVAAEGAYLCNLHAGGSARANPGLTDVQKETVRRVQDFMRDHNMYFAGIDFLGNILTEVNITCPTTILQMNQIYGRNLEDILIEDTLNWPVDR